METPELLADAFGRIQEEVHTAAADLSAEGLNFRPDPDANSISWLIWHLTRVQDHHVSGLAQRAQTYVVDGWSAQMGLSPDEQDHGYGHTSAQVAAVTFDSPDLLLAYHDAVHARSLEYVANVTPAELDRIVDTNWDPHVTAGVRIVSVVDDCMNHAGQANYVRGMFERTSDA